MSKVKFSRFTIHDEETAPAASAPILKASGAGQLPNFLGVLAGSPAALRAYVRFRHELRQGALAEQTVERIALGVAARHGDDSALALRERTARRAGLGLDEIARARRWKSSDARHGALLRWLEPLTQQRPVPDHLHEEVREHGWTEAELLEAVALVALESFTAMIGVAGNVPPDGSAEETRQLRAVA